MLIFESNLSIFLKEVSIAFYYNLSKFYNIKLIKIPEKINDNDVLICLLTDVRLFYNHINENTKLLLINTESFYEHKFQLEVIHKLKNFKYISILEYKSKNIEFVKSNFPNFNIIYFPFTINEHFYKFYNNISVEKDIDILFYGSLNDRRRKIIDQLSKKYKVYYTQNFGNLNIQSSYIKRSKIVLNLYYYENNKIFDFYRLSFLIQMKSFFITEIPEIDYSIQKELIDYENYIFAVEYDKIIELCENMLKNDENYRNEKAEICYNWFNSLYNFDKKLKNIIETNYLITIRDLVINDYEKGYIELTQKLSKYEKFISREEFENYIIKNNTKIVVIELDNKIIACGSLFILNKIHSNNIAQIEDIIVDEQYRNHGLGNKIIKYLIEESKKYNCYKIVLNCIDENLNYYEKLGFKKVGNQMKYII